MIKRNKASPPQKGRVTHHHDQFMNPVSFSTTKATPSNPIADAPELLDELEFDISFD